MRSDAVSPKAADILDKVMSQDAAGQQPQQHHHHFHPNLSNLPDLRSSSSPHQHQPLTLSTSVPAPSPYEHHQHFLSARHNMVTSVSLPKDSTTETGRHYSSLQSDLNDSIDKSMEDESEDDYDDDFSQGGHLKSPGQTSQEESSYSSSRLNFDPSPTPDKGSEKKNRESPEILSPISKRFFPEPSQNAPFGAHFVQMHSEFGRMVYPCDPLSCSSIGNSRNTTTVTYTSSYTGRGDNPAHQPYPLDHSDRKAIPKSSPTDGHRGLFSFPQNLQHGRADNSQQHSTFSRSFSPTKEQECVPNLAHTDRGSDPNSSDLSRGTLLKYPLPPGSMGMFPGLRGGMGVGNDMPPHVGDALMSPSAGLLPPPVRPPYLGHGMSQCMSAERQKHVFFCHLCSYSGAVKEDFDAHMGTHFEYNCPHCDYTSRTEGRLKRHIKDFHTDPENKHRSMPGRPKVYRCKQCEFSCIDKIVFWAHARTHIKEDKLLQCPRCPFVTEYKHHLEYHLRNHFGSKPFKCGKCNYSCVNKSMLNSHMKSHTNVYQYRCADCTYATKYCHSLKLHLRKYNHKPATVLNNDGSLPQGIDAELSGLSLLAKRGPPRGPRGLRKEKDRNAGSEPFIPGMFPMPPNPHHPMNSMINGVIMAAAQAAQYWPLLPNGMHPPPPLISMGGTNGQDPPFLPGFMKMNRLPPPELHKDGEVFDVRDSRSELKCKMCDFFCQSVDVLDAHTQKVHKGENRDLGNLMPFKQLPDQSAEEMAQRQLTRRTSAPPCAPMPAASPNTTLSDTYPRRYSVSDTTGASFQSQRETASNQFKVSPGSWSHYAARMNKINEEEYSRDYMNNFYIGERLKSDKECEERHKPEPPLEGADILRQMTLKFGNSPGSPPPPTLSLPPPSLDQSHAGSTLAPQQPDLQQSVKESPLDLTNKPKSVSPQHSQSPSPPALTLSGLCPSSGPTAVIPSTKRTHPETTLNSSEENSCSGDIPVASPRKRSRKGKAYKLETLCLKLQEKQVPSPYQSESEDSDQADLQNHSAVECANQLEDLERSEDKSSSHVEVHSSEARAKKTVGREEIQNEKEENRRSGPPIVDSEFEQLQQNLRILNNDLHPNESSPTGNECPLPHTGSSNSEVSRAETDTQKQDFKSALPSSIHEPPVINEPILQSPEDPEKETASLITAIYHHRRKPVTPALRRGAELAWKILNHPASGLPTANNKPSQCQQNDGSTDAPPPSHRNGFTNGSSNSYFTLTSLSPALNGVGNGAALAGARSLERQSTHAQTYNPLPLMTTEESSVQVTPSSKTDFYECSYCEISFRDCIMYTIHMGYHGYQNPYKCNMCGQTSKDKVEFFLHIARAAHN